jgi:hypothetical protein
MLSSFLLPFINHQQFIFKFKPSQKTYGKIIKVKKTFWTSENKPIYKYNYSFTDEKDLSYSGKSYSVEILNITQEVTVKYITENPKISVVENMRPALFPLTLILIPLVVLFSGFLFIFAGFEKGSTLNRLLKYGRLTYAELKEKKETKLFFKGSPVYKLFFEYTDIDQKQKHITFKTHRMDKLSADGKEPVFYDPLKYKKAVMPLSLTSEVIYTEAGDLSCQNPAKKLTLLLFPLSAAAVLILTAWFYLN